MPMTKAGKWSLWQLVGLGISFMVFSVMAILSGIPGLEGSATMTVLLSAPLVLAAVCGIASLLTGLTGVIFYKERSPIILLPIIIGFVVLVFTLGETISGH